jgi:uncharacterized protein YchJ
LKIIATPFKSTKLYLDPSSENEMRSRISAKRVEDKTLVISPSGREKDAEDSLQNAKTNTVNERLMAELQAATDAEKGSKTEFGKKFKDAFKYSEKSEAERELAIEQARDLNGVNPTVTILASFFAFGMAYGLWWLTGFLGALFVSHPISADAPYAFSRIAAVFRNVIMGLSSLASGFSFVSGLGVFLLGVRVAYGVLTGELDPTPIQKPGLKNDQVEIPNVWDLMMNKKPGRKGRR